MKELISFNLNTHVEEWILRCQLITEPKRTILENKLVSLEKTPYFYSKMLLIEKRYFISNETTVVRVFQI